jgi:hypothetical protein
MIKPINILASYQYKSNDWSLKKEAIKQHLKFNEMVRTPPSVFNSDKNIPRYYVENFISIFNEELTEFATELGIKSFDVKDIWTVNYKQGDFHDPHCHGFCNYSGILYLDYDENVHTPTYYITEPYDSVSERTIIHKNDVTEGDIVIFPSSVLHYSRPNTSIKDRNIISFDINVRQ